MSYNVQHIDKFGGINSNIHPELIDPAEFRDLVNWRHERVGKLVVRNGQVIGLYAGDGNALALDVLKKIYSFAGIGELIVSEAFDPFGTDRFMVYAVQLWTEDEPLEFAYILAPVNADPTYNNKTFGFGDYDGQFIFMKYIPENSVVDEHTQAFATTTNHKVFMQQLSRRLIVADNVNGDLAVVDRFDEADIDQCAVASHEIIVRSNTLDRFNVNIVELEDRTETGQENAVVKHGLVLYGFELPKSRTVRLNDNFVPVFRGLDSDLTRAVADVLAVLKDNTKPTLFTFGLFATDVNGATLYEPGKYTCVEVRPNADPGAGYVFTNAEDNVEFDNVLGRLQLPEDEYEYSETDENGKTVTISAKDRAANTYTWKDFVTEYYPSSGVSEGIKFLRELDRQFDKLTSGAPKIKSLKRRGWAGQRVPLGVWSYRFVWEYEGGDFSAPSTPLMCPDMLFSAVKDADFEVYSRPTLPLENGDLNDPYALIGDILEDERFFGVKTRILELVHSLKSTIYDANHKFGRQNPALSSNTDEQNGRLMTLITARFPVSETLRGTAIQAAIANQSPAKSVELGIRIPYFPSGPSHTYNSMFTVADGKFRRAWTERQFVFIGENSFASSTAIGQLGYDLTDGDTSTKWNFVNTDIVLNYASLDTATDHNNEPNFGEADRLHTIFRGIQNDTDSLADTVMEDTDAFSRLVLEGTIGLQLTKSSENIHITPTYLPYTEFDDILDYTDARSHYYLHSVRFTGSKSSPVSAPNSQGASANIDIYSYAAASRFIGIEQVTSYVPASVLFGAPRVQLRIDADNVPARAKKLHLFRTLSSHSNNWQPGVYGFVTEVSVKSNQDIVIFDDVEDDNLNFLVDVDDYDGLDKPLKSNNLIVADDRMFYFDYQENYQPPKPRTA